MVFLFSEAEQSHLSRLALKIVVMTREQGTLNWELLTGNRGEVLGNFTFRYLCRLFSVHLLRCWFFTVLSINKIDVYLKN